MGRELVVAGLGTALGYTVLYGGPVYRAAVVAETGWSAEATAGAFALGFAAAIPTPLLAGLAADRWGLRAPLAAGAALIALAAGGAAAAGALWQWYASVGIGLVVGAKTLWAAATILAARSARPGRAVGALRALIGATLALGPLITRTLIDTAGWRAVLALKAVLLMGFAVWAAWPRARPAAPPLPEPGAERRHEGGPWVVAPTVVAAFFAGNLLIGIFDESVSQHGIPSGSRWAFPGSWRQV